MITLKGKKVTLTGKDAENLKAIAKILNTTEQEALDLAVRYQIGCYALDKKIKTAKKTNKRSK